MGVDNAIARSKQIISLLWSILLILFIVWVAYFIYKQNKKKRSIKEKLNIGKKMVAERKKKVNVKKEEETSLVNYPVYNFKETEGDYKVDTNYKLSNDNFFTYEDLKELTDKGDDQFFNEYLQSVKKCYEDKKDWYLDKLEEKNEELESKKKAANKLSDYDENLKELNDYVRELTSIITEIEEKKKVLSVSTLKNNFRRMIWNKKKGVESMIGRKEVKNFLAREIFSFKKDPTNSYTSFQNFLVLGDSGVGKNKLAECVSYCYCMSGITVRDKYCVISKAQVESQFVGGTGPKLRDRLLAYLEAIILLDEIYGLVPNKNSLLRNASHGEDAVNQLVFFTEEFKGKSRIGGMGYEGNMLDDFIGSNQGMDRRFPQNRRIILGNYDDEELANILIRILNNRNDLDIKEEVGQALHGMITKAKKRNKGIFKLQAGAVDNIASHIITVINSLKYEKWIKGDHENNKKLLLIGFSDYLSQYYGFGLSDGLS